MGAGADRHEAQSFRLKVLHVITGVNVGGAETMLARLIEQHGRAPDIASEVLSLMAPGFVGQRIAANAVPVHTLAMHGGWPSLSAAARLVRITRAIAPDVIMGWMHHGQIAASLAAWPSHRRTPVIWNVRHSLDGLAHEKPMTKAVLRLGSWLSHTPGAIIYNSAAAARQYRALGFHTRNELVIPNGFDLPPVDRVASRARLCAAFGIADAARVVGMVARNHPMKDVGTLVTAFGRVLAQMPDAHLLIVGEGMDRPDPGVAAALARIPATNVTLAGHRGDVGAWLAGLDVLALSSAWGEGFPNIVGEAMAAEVPAVSTDVGDAGYLIGETGCVVPACDPQSLAQALVSILALPPAARRALGVAARRRIADNFTIEGIADRYFALLRAAAPSGSAVGATPLPATARLKLSR